MNPDRKPVLILGIGNVLLGDEGVGVHAVRRFEQTVWPDGVRLLDGGTGGFHLLELFELYDPIIMIDATMDGRPAGTITRLTPRFASDFPRSLSAHDIGLRDLVESAQLLSGLPAMHLLTVSIDSLQEMSMELSPPVAGAIPRLESEVRELLASLPA